MFVSKGVKKMIDESDKFIDVSEKLKGGMDEAIAISRHVSVMYPEVSRRRRFMAQKKR